MLTFEELQKANATIKTTPIKNKEYAEVNQRIKAFRMLFPEGSILTDMISNDGNTCVFKAIIRNGDLVLGTGTAFENKDSSFINKTSYIENCETSAVGRALAMCGIGIDVSIASYEEVGNAMQNQDNQTPQKSEAMQEAELKAKVIGYINRHKLSPEDVQKLCAHYKIQSLQQLTGTMCRDYIAKLEKNGGKIDE